MAQSTQLFARIASVHRCCLLSVLLFFLSRAGSVALLAAGGEGSCAPQQPTTDQEVGGLEHSTPKAGG